MEANESNYQSLNWRKAALLAFVAIAAFHITYTPSKSGPLAFAIVGYLVCLVQLARLPTTRQCIYWGLVVGFVCFAPQLECFWRIFGPMAMALWLVLAFWIALFLALSHLALVRLGPVGGALLIPFLWTGLEYFRSELYYLKFSWLNVGYAFAEFPPTAFRWLGMYGLGFVAVALALAIPPIVLVHIRNPPLVKLLLWILLFAGFAALLLPYESRRIFPANFVAAGVQLEFPEENAIRPALDRILAAQATMPLKGYWRATNADLVVLPEYTLDGEPTPALKDWCREHQKFLTVGGRDAFPGSNYFNTAYVISTNGEVVFKQVKSVPIQFFTDGLPARQLKVWDSPWGKIGICICYDLSYTRVMDELVRQGAQLLIVPTMDVATWGRHQHELHARVAPVRAAEYGVPIFRVASSGISQGVSSAGRVQTIAPFPGEGEMIFFGAWLSPGQSGSLPLDRYLAPACVAITGAFVVWLAVVRPRRPAFSPGAP